MEKYIAAYMSWCEEQGRGMEESEFKVLESNLDPGWLLLDKINLVRKILE